MVSGRAVEPGTVFRSRRVIAAFFGLIPSPVQTWQLLYRTVAADGSPLTTVTTIFKPANAKLDRFVSFQTAYDSTNNRCSPSYSYQLGAIPEELVTQSERFALAVWLLSGYIVASPDYEGPDAAYAVGRIQGPEVLDGMRAVRNFAKNLGMSTDNPAIFGTGYSGGGVATPWAAALQRNYAPELNIKGWASGGTPANLTATLATIDGTLFSGCGVLAMNGLSKPTAFGKELKPILDDIVTASGRVSMNIVNSRLGSGLLFEPTVRRVLDSLVLGENPEEVPTAPIHLYHGKLDELVPYGPADKLANAWCERGASVHFTNIAAGGHITSEILGLLGALSFASDSFDGKVPKGCTRDKIVDETLNPVAWVANLEPIAFKLIEFLAHVGKADENIIKNPNLLQTIIPFT
ncbi:hypothetical protein MY10362_003831 [Beauveria mimosiformis]